MRNRCASFQLLRYLYMYLKRVFLFGGLLIAFCCTKAADSLQVSLNKTLFKKGDSLFFDGYIPEYARLKLSNATMNVWIDDPSNGRRWKFRYPIVDGSFSGSLSIGEKISDGHFAINFLVQPGYCKILGTLVDPGKSDTLINYLMIPKNKKATFFDNTKVNRDGSFRLKSMLFEDSAYFVFTPVKKVKTNDLLIHLETPLDSFFVPVLSATRFITLQRNTELTLVNEGMDTTHYVFSFDEPDSKTGLPGVTVYGKTKKKIERFDEENSRGVFQKNDALLFDGLENAEIGRSLSVLRFLQGKVPGLSIETDSAGNDVAKWRNEIAEIYVDEFKTEAGDHLFISPASVAMIKVYRPPAQLSPFSNAGAIVIYTKKGEYATGSAMRHNFIVKGYTAAESIWE